VSDAGTPGIADPGSQLAKAAIEAGVAVFPIPGASAAVSALIASGLSAESFTFHGFLPSKQGQRRSVLEALARGGPTHVFYETPHRILEALADVMAVFGDAQPVVVAREITKLHEEFLRGTVAGVHGSLAARDVVRGEMVLLFAPAEERAVATATLAEAVEALMRSESLKEKDALKRVARERGIGKSEAYREYQRTQNKRH
jgi:16S rRNA (cytidine1402-2'-O)-methyltransferase